jgi:hypothetical protein
VEELKVWEELREAHQVVQEVPVELLLEVQVILSLAVEVEHMVMAVGAAAVLVVCKLELLLYLLQAIR